MEMKDSGISWIGQIPNSWRILPIRSIFDEVTVKNINGEITTALKFTYGDIVKKDNFKDDDPYVAKTIRNYLIVDKGDIVINGLNLNFDFITQRVGLVNSKGVITPAYMVLRPKHCAEVDPEFLTYLLKACDYKKAFHNMGAGVRKILNFSELKRNYLVIPSKTEQSHIAGFITKQCFKINSLIEKTRQSITKLEEYKKALITQVVTKGLDPNVEMKNSGVHWIGEIPKNWNLSKIKYIAELNPTVNLYQIKPCSRVTFTPMEYIKNGYYIPHDCEYSAISRGSYTQYQEDDIVIAKVTPCFENGNIAIMHNLLSGLGLGSSELFVLRAKNILKEYLFFFLQSEKFKTQGVLSFSGASGLKRVSSAFILNCPLPVPSIEEQRHISNFLYKKSDDIHKLISQKLSIINKLEEYRKSLIFEYVTGKKSVEEN